MNILLTSVILRDNFGYPSIISSLKTLWGERDGDLRMTIASADKSPEEDSLRKLYGMGHIDITNLSRRKNFFKVLMKCRRYKRTGRIDGDDALSENLRKLAAFDAIVEMRGICFSDDIGGQRLYTKLFNFPLWIFGKAMGIPVVKYTTAIGPARKLSTRLSIKIYLGRFCDLVLLRDDESYDICKALHIKTPYLTVPDTAFYMPVEPCGKAGELAELKAGMPVIGISVSHQLMKRAPGYMESMAELIGNLADELKAKVVLIANEFTKDLSFDDKAVARQLFEMAGRQNVEILDVDQYTPNQIKSVVSACDVMVCARYHSVVASLSSSVPLLALSWHHKYKEAMKLFELEEYVIEKQDIGNSVVDGFYRVYHNRDEIHARLKRNLPLVLGQVTAGAEAFYKVMGGMRAPEGR